MAVNNRQHNVAYGLSDALLNVPSLPIISERAPTANDKAPLGTIWVNKQADDAFVLTSVAANIATWIAIGGGGTGVFTDLIVTHDATITNALTVTNGDFLVTNGDIFVGDSIFSANDIQTQSGDFISVTGGVLVNTDITTTNGSISAPTGIISGDSVLVGNVVTATNDITTNVGDFVALTGNIEAESGTIAGGSLYATDDMGGLTGFTGFTNVTNITQSTGALSILSTTANPGDNAGFIKIYVGNTTAYLPYFTDIAP